jgi:hypothetical protein
MKLYFIVCLILINFLINTSYGQSYECDNNFGDCGTPNQSGGGGGGGSILIANTDLGDTYQNADDYDDDGIEDSFDNCIRQPNTDQFDRDGDGIGDFCDNCLDLFNPQQENTDGDSYGDFCDNDIDNDGLLNINDPCPFHWGEESCFNVYQIKTSNDNVKHVQRDVQDNTSELPDLVNQESCQQSTTNNSFVLIFVSVLVYFLRFKISVREK